MTDKFTFSQKVANPSQNNGQTIHNKSAEDQRRETHPFNMGFDQKKVVKRGKNGKNERKKGPGETGNVKGSFWTACSYCYYKFEYEKKYEECSLRCRNCRKGFHAVAVAPPSESLLAKYSSGNSSMGDKKETRRRGKGKRHDVVEISDSDDEKKELGVKIEANKVKAEGFNNSEGSVVMKRLKSVARNTKKIAGRGIKIKKVENGVADGCNEDEVEVVDDIFVGLRDIS